MTPQYQRAVLLYGQQRYDLAEAELRRGLASEPSDPFSHGLLAICLSHQKRFDEAEQEAKQAVHFGPDVPYGHYALAWVLHDRNHFDAALSEIKEALRLDAEDADFHALQAQIHLEKREWHRALESAEEGLQLDAEHLACTNLRAMALVRLGRKSEAGATIDAALARNPENSVTHANQGWTLLHQGEAAKALEHFRESLRLDPQNEWARQGVVEALKARNIIYAIMLKYFLWIGRLDRRVQWGIVVGGYFLSQSLGSASAKNPELAPVLLPIRLLFLVFVFLTWTADSLFNLLLRLNRFGRMVLSREQVIASNWIGGLVFLALLSLGLYLARAGSFFGLGAFVFGFSVLPVAAAFRCQPGGPRRIMAVYSGVMLLAGLIAFGMSATEQWGHQRWSSETKGLFTLCLGIFFLGVIGAGWVANALIMMRPRR